jgi:anti-anti-sigma regulatory factor
MNSKMETSAEKTSVVLPGSCTLKEAATVKALLVSGLDMAGNVELDVRAVERVDTSVLQLLVAFTRDMKDAGRAVTWFGFNEEMNRSVRQLGLDGVLGVGGAA